MSQRVVRDFLRDHNRRRRTTILLTSHYMADIQELCERVVIIDRGTLFFDGRLSDILDRFADFKVVTVQLATGAAALLPDPARYGQLVDSEPGTLRLRVKRDRVIAACKALLDELPVKDIDIEEVPVEDIIRQLFQRDTPPAAAAKP